MHLLFLKDAEIQLPPCDFSEHMFRFRTYMPGGQDRARSVLHPIPRRNLANFPAEAVRGVPRICSRSSPLQPVSR